MYWLKLAVFYLEINSLKWILEPINTNVPVVLTNTKSVDLLPRVNVVLCL